MRSFHMELDEAFEYFEENDSSYWNGHHQATIAKVRNRFGVLPSKCGGLLVHGRVDYGDSPQVDGPFGDREMRVVDISHLSGVPQDLVVTKVMNTVWEMAEQGRLGVDKLVIFVDELNKYAPSGSRSTSLKDTLVDISARGRHLNLTLFGAQQFRSKVDDEVVGNAATSLYGRIGDEEITNTSYRSFSSTTRDELLQLEKGRLLLRHAHYAVPVFGRFPRPPVLMGKAGTDIFGGQRQDPASSVLAVMRGLTSKPPGIAAVRAEIEGVPEEQVYEALDAVQTAHRSGKGSADPYKNFVWNVKRGAQRSRSNGREASKILSGLDRVRD
jgi:DNA helicase HerA-like ATPase